MASSSARGLQLALRLRTTGSSSSTTTTTTTRYFSTAQRTPSLRALSSIQHVPATQKQQQQQAARFYSSLNGTQPLKGRVVEPLLGTGPPPDAPVPSPEFAATAAASANGVANGKDAKVQDDSTLKAALLKRRMKVARALQAMREANKKAVSSTEVRRFWKSTSVKEVQGTFPIVHISRSPRRVGVQEGGGYILAPR